MRATLEGQGDTADWLAELAIDDPDAAAHADAAAARRVGPDPWNQWVWRAWHRLTHDRHWRPSGLAASVPGRIPFNAVDTYAKRHGIRDERFIVFDQLLVEMDTEYLTWAKEQAKKEGDENS